MQTVRKASPSKSQVVNSALPGAKHQSLRHRTETPYLLLK
jgi:hypothetical protein